MRPTRRGWVVIAAVAIAFASASAYGPRGLNALVAPGIVALVAAALQMYRFEPPALDREIPVRGECGSTVHVRLTFETDSPRSAHVVEAVDEGLGVTGTERTLTLGSGSTTIEYGLHLRTRGERRVGPSTVVTRDVLGLVRRRHTYHELDRILVHPRVNRLSGPRREALSRLHGGTGDDRQAFDGLRYYRRGDPLRDVHWKSSAKHPDGDLVVRQFATEEGDRTVEMAAESAPGSADAMAEATASIVVALLEAGVRVGLQTPTGRVSPDDSGGRVALLDHLAVAEAGSVSEAVLADADVRVAAAAEGVHVTVGDRDVEFSALAGTSLVGVGSSDSVGTSTSSNAAESAEAPDGDTNVGVAR